MRDDLRQVAGGAPRGTERGGEGVAVTNYGGKSWSEVIIRGGAAAPDRGRPRSRQANKKPKGFPEGCHIESSFPPSLDGGDKVKIVQN